MFNSKTELFLKIEVQEDTILGLIAKAKYDAEVLQNDFAKIENAIRSGIKSENIAPTLE